VLQGEPGAIGLLAPDANSGPGALTVSESVDLILARSALTRD
jgi:hypothetical protein